MTEDRFDQQIESELGRGFAESSARSRIALSHHTNPFLHRRFNLMARLSGLSLAPKMAAALGAGVLALSAIGAGAAAAVTQSPNPAAWGQHVQQAVEDCKKALALQPGEHGIGACVSAFA